MAAVGADARGIAATSYEELLEKSDLVVIAKATRTGDTRERAFLPTFPRLEVVGVETAFAASAVLKGDKNLKEFVLHHYRSEGAVPNGPLFAAFDVSKGRSFLLFLVKEPDGRYAPAIGQTDPAYQCVQALADAAASRDLFSRFADSVHLGSNASIRSAINLPEFAQAAVRIEQRPRLARFPREIGIALYKG
jgi:hypothetical protein